MTSRIRRLLAVPALVAALGISACADDRPDRAVTIDSEESEPGGIASPDQQTEPDEGGAGAEAPASSAGNPLSEEEAAAALLTVEDLPTGWSRSPEEEDDDEGEDTIEPVRCQEVLDALDTDSDDADVEAEADFSKGGAFGTLLNQTISSYADEVDPEVVQEIADAFSDCPKFTSTDDEGEVSNVTVSPLSFANLGDQTLAVTMTFETSMFEVAFNLAFVVIGHNVLALVNGGIAGADGAELEKLAKVAVRKLEDAAR